MQARRSGREPRSSTYHRAVDSATRHRASFRALHEHGCFVVPNPWDVGSAIALERLGFSALATTTAGFAFSRGLPDAPDALAVEDVLEHIAQIAEAVNVPVNADFQAGYASDADGVGISVRRCVDAGVAGLSIEDVRPEPSGDLFEVSEAVRRVQAARDAIDGAGADVLLTARAECFLVGHPDPLAESIRRLRQYADAGADVLFAPGVHEPDQIRTIVEAVAPKPVNVLVSADSGLTVSGLAELGVRRVSVGSALARVAWGSFLDAATTIARDGGFTGLDGAADFQRLNALFGSA